MQFLQCLFDGVVGVIHQQRVTQEIAQDEEVLVSDPVDHIFAIGHFGFRIEERFVLGCGTGYGGPVRGVHAESVPAEVFHALFFFGSSEEAVNIDPLPLMHELNRSGFAGGSEP